MASRHCDIHNAVPSHDMDGVKGHALACFVSPRYQYWKRDKPDHKGLLKATGGPTNIECGSFMPDEVAQALIRRRPGSEQKMRELSGNNIFEGPYPVKENYGGMIRRCPPAAGGPTNVGFGSFMPDEVDQALIRRRPGSEQKMREMSGNNIFEGPYPVKENHGDMIRRCPPRTYSSCKARDLKGHNIFAAFTCPYEPPKPPPVRPYEPEELPLPPNKLRRNLTKLSSHFNLGGPVCIEPMMPPNQAAWAKQKMLYGSMDDLDKDFFPKSFVSNMKARELAGHTNLFGTPPRLSMPSTPVPESCVFYGGVEDDLRQRSQLVHKTKMQALHGHDAVFLNSNACCPGKPTPLSHRKAQELRGNDIFASIKPDPRRCHKACKASSRGNSRQFSGGKSSRASSKCSDFLP